MEQIQLTLAMAEEAIAKLEAEHGLTSEQFLADMTLVGEDDAFEWEAYLSSRQVLRGE